MAIPGTQAVLRPLLGVWVGLAGDAGPNVGRWIADTARERQRLERILGNKPTNRLTKDDIKALVASLRDITATLAAADPTDKAAVYEEMGIDLTYHQDGQVIAESRPRVVNDGVGGPIPVLTTRPAVLVRLYSIAA